MKTEVKILISSHPQDSEVGLYSIFATHSAWHQRDHRWTSAYRF